jgi:hypothetical protein
MPTAKQEAKKYKMKDSCYVAYKTGVPAISSRLIGVILTKSSELKNKIPISPTV